ncbi:TatD family hydrolase [Hydrogenimonas cancrithermarum]|uniref:TatD-related deoxyribonuclease n=1 Tax=Hydrogenimonas cancrithermarum TaxID=2993563 RepID=A0ABM8FPU9_9BACT|nr:TatD family hydrolase [Hydrogenimonas cancrithermarum]BDY13911.1 TatD-related deoxyribonuclease [Hydrogenimonas cancrithermarum]
MIIDTHCHLDDPRFDDDLEEVIARAREHGVRGFLIPGADPDTLQKAQAIAHRFDGVYYAAGVHPYDTQKYDEALLREHLKDEKCIAVGECGLDYYRLSEDEAQKHEEVAEQKRVFGRQIELAKAVGKPLIVHIRDASDDSMQMLIDHGAGEVGGVLHCYNADEQLLKLADYGFYYGIGGVVTFKNAKKLPHVLPKIPYGRLVVETDAPYLTPHPFRGKRNEPYYTVFVVERIADILGKSVEEIERVTTENACRLFRPFSTV